MEWSYITLITVSDAMTHQLGYFYGSKFLTTPYYFTVTSFAK